MMEKAEHTNEIATDMIAPNDLVDKPRMNFVIDDLAHPHWIWRIAGIGGAALLLLGAITSGCKLRTFCDYPSAAIVLGCTLLLTIGVFGWKGMLGSFQTLFAGRSSSNECENAIAIFRFGAGFALAAGFLGTLIGLIHILANMDDPSRIGAGMAIALLTQTYGVVLATLLCTAAAIVARRNIASPHLKRTSTASVVAAAGASAIGTATTLLLMTLIMVSFKGH